MVKCLIYSRVSGYYTNTDQWNSAKKEEFSERRGLRYDRHEQTTDARSMEKSI